MKIYTLCFLLSLAVFSICNAQTTPASSSGADFFKQEELTSISDTIDFTPYSTGTLITTQYLYDGAIFSGYNGSSDPVIHDYVGSWGRVLHSDNWYNPLRLDFVNPLNTLQHQLVQYIEFDNPISSEVDYISVDVYDSLNTLIYHYLSTSPEHIVINLPVPSAAYMTFDDSAGTAFVIDNIYFIDGITSTENEQVSNRKFQVFPNPFKDELTVIIPALARNESVNEKMEIYDMYGRLVLSKPLLSEDGSIEQSVYKMKLNDFTNGVYYLSLYMDGIRVVKKIVKA